MHIATMAFFVGLQVAGPASEWTALTGADKIEYRWSRPANNSCLVEFRSSDSNAPEKFTAVATIVTNAVPKKPDVTNRPRVGPVPPSIVKENKEDRTSVMELTASGTSLHSFGDCYRVVFVKAENMSPTSGSASPADAESRSAADTRRKTGEPPLHNP